MKILINLIGEQPIPNLLPVLYLKPDKTIILFTEKTRGVANRLVKLVQNCSKEKISPYNLNAIISKLEDITDENNQYIFNITGGTKLMSIALFQFSVQTDSKIVYLQSEKNKNILHSFTIGSDDFILTKNEELPELISLDLYLKAHLPDYKTNEENNSNDFGIQFENAVIDTLKENNFEVIQGVKPTSEGEQVEIDAVFRLIGTNTVAIAEIKVGDSKMERPKKGIDQLSTAGSREYLGTYTKKYLITARILNERIRKAAKAHNIVIIDGIRFNYRRKIIHKKYKQILIEKIMNNFR